MNEPMNPDETFQFKVIVHTRDESNNATTL